MIGGRLYIRGPANLQQQQQVVWYCSFICTCEQSAQFCSTLLVAHVQVLMLAGHSVRCALCVVKGTIVEGFCSRNGGLYVCLIVFLGFESCLMSGTPWSRYFNSSRLHPAQNILRNKCSSTSTIYLLCKGSTLGHWGLYSQHGCNVIRLVCRAREWGGLFGWLLMQDGNREHAVWHVHNSQVCLPKCLQGVVRAFVLCRPVQSATCCSSHAFDQARHQHCHSSFAWKEQLLQLCMWADFVQLAFTDACLNQAECQQHSDGSSSPRQLWGMHMHCYCQSQLPS